jgi:hypothetical protein
MNHAPPATRIDDEQQRRDRADLGRDEGDDDRREDPDDLLQARVEENSAVSWRALTSLG